MSDERKSVPIEHLTAALNYVKYCDPNQVMKGDAHSQQQIVDWLKAALAAAPAEQNAAVQDHYGNNETSPISSPAHSGENGAIPVGTQTSTDRVKLGDPASAAPSTPGDDFLAWWKNEQPLDGLSDACKYSAWNAWLHVSRKLSEAQRENAELRKMVYAIPAQETLQHSRSFPAYVNEFRHEICSEDCNCSLIYRIRLQTAETVSYAWRERAESAERENAELSHCLTASITSLKSEVKHVESAKRENERLRLKLVESASVLQDLLSFCQRRIPTGSIPPQGQRAIDFLERIK